MVLSNIARAILSGAMTSGYSGTRRLPQPGLSVRQYRAIGALIGLTGSAAFGDTPVLSTSYSLDGEVWSEDRVITAGVTGERAKRLMWFMQGFMRNWRIQRFRGTSDVHMGFIRLEARLEPMAF